MIYLESICLESIRRGWKHANQMKSLFLERERERERLCVRGVDPFPFTHRDRSIDRSIHPSIFLLLLLLRLLLLKSYSLCREEEMWMFYAIGLPLTLAMVTATLRYFSGPDVSPYVLSAVGYTWFCSVSIIVLVPADIWTVLPLPALQKSSSSSLPSLSPIGH